MKCTYLGHVFFFFRLNPCYKLVSSRRPKIKLYNLAKVFRFCHSIFVIFYSIAQNGEARQGSFNGFVWKPFELNRFLFLIWSRWHRFFLKPHCYIFREIRDVMIFFYSILKRYYNVKKPGFWGRTPLPYRLKKFPANFRDPKKLGSNIIQHGGKDCDLQWLGTFFGAKATMNLPSVLALAFQDLFPLVWLYLGTRKMAAEL